MTKNRRFAKKVLHAIVKTSRIVLHSTEVRKHIKTIRYLMLGKFNLILTFHEHLISIQKHSL